MGMGLPYQGACVEVKEQSIEVSSLLPTKYMSQGFGSAHQAWQGTLLPLIHLLGHRILASFLEHFKNHYLIVSIFLPVV